MNEDLSEEIVKPEGPDPYSEMTVKIPLAISLFVFIVVALVGCLDFGRNSIPSEFPYCSSSLP